LYLSEIKNIDLSYHAIKTQIPDEERKKFIMLATMLSKATASDYSSHSVVKKADSTAGDVLAILKKIVILPYLNTINTLDDEPMFPAELAPEELKGIFNMTSKFLIAEYVSMVLEVGEEMAAKKEYTEELSECLKDEAIKEMII
jgi:hypothetical protein